eukprot:TRINITY_DN4223_c0_g1_i1.p1 TRINITY_DN4223_c0_g1~~TRINITY_DN4223_c0_g1_i1.p1  ORF type:complete len:219 (+),score=41.22 TRINITY_DN4223_c0_g1_i1:98-754(+)
MAQPVVLGYWSIRGLAQAVRFMCEYTEQPYTEKIYDCGEAPGYDRSCWTNEKHSLGLDFPNLPYLFDGDLKITQSSAILRHIARKHSLLGSSAREAALADQAAEQTIDLRQAMVSLAYNPQFTELFPKFAEDAKAALAKFDAVLSRGPWLAGDNITYADFMFYEVCCQLRDMSAEILADSANVRGLMGRFEALPAIARYTASERFKARPYNNKMASFK